MPNDVLRLALRPVPAAHTDVVIAVTWLTRRFGQERCMEAARENRAENRQIRSLALYGPSGNDGPEGACPTGHRLAAVAAIGSRSC
jgi:hypothetical protein